MGIWGYGPLENDDATDWLDELIDDQDIRLLKEAFNDVIGKEAREEYLEVTECSAAVVAAEILAQLVGYPTVPPIADADDLEELSKAFSRIKNKGKLIEQACGSVQRIMTDKENSELYQAWEDDDEGFKAWTASLQNLLDRLKQAEAFFEMHNTKPQ